MAEDVQHVMESRVTAVEDGLRALRKDVTTLNQTFDDALRGTISGQPGIIATLNSSLQASRENATKLDALGVQSKGHGDQLESLRLDKAKVIGIVIGTSILWGAFITILGLILKYVR